MSVRSSLLAILTIGPAYGFQLHSELKVRTGGRRAVNVGQIYGTLERLGKQGAVESAGVTDDGLPLYRLTPDGRSEALAWLHDTRSAAGDEWNDLIDRVLIASSLPGVDTVGIIAGYRQHWTARDDAAPASGQAAIASFAASALAAAALNWLARVEALLLADADGSFHRELGSERPRRGRRPAAP